MPNIPIGKRNRLKEKLIRERKECEVRIYERELGKELHTCGGGTHMHEVIFTKGDISKVRGTDRDYFWDERNFALVCGNSHTEAGHSTDFREWWLNWAERYGDVCGFIWGAKKYLTVLV